MNQRREKNRKLIRPKASSLKRSTKIDKSLAGLTKKKKERPLKLPGSDSGNLSGSNQS